MNVGDSIPANRVRAREQAMLLKRIEAMAATVNARRTCGNR